MNYRLWYIVLVMVLITGISIAFLISMYHNEEDFMNKCISNNGKLVRGVYVWRCENVDECVFKKCYMNKEDKP